MSAAPEEITVNPENRGRLDTPGDRGWEGSARHGAEKKHLIVSTDSHLERTGAVIVRSEKAGRFNQGRFLPDEKRCCESLGPKQTLCEMLPARG